MLPVPKTIPPVISGWGDSYFFNNQTIKGFYWHQYAGFLYTQTPTYQFNVWPNVPQSVAQSMASQPNFNADAYYAGFATEFQPCLLTEDCVPLITETGAFLVVS